MKFYVTAEDIKNGCPLSPRLCPVARCINRALPKSKVSVGGTYLLIDHKDLDLPKTVREFVWQFDDGEPVKPFSFSIPNLERIMQ